MRSWHLVAKWNRIPQTRKGYIYIASAFETVNRSVCGQKRSWVDNDPHFWTSPPTWGICRNDLRTGAEIGDVIFFVLPRRGRHPQMIFGFLKVAKKISHLEAFARPELRSKRMGNKMPNGNITQHLAYGHAGQSKIPRYRPLTSALYQNRSPYTPVDLHLVHPSGVPRSRYLRQARRETKNPAVYFYSATPRRSRGVVWPSIAPALTVHKSHPAFEESRSISLEP